MPLIDDKEDFEMNASNERVIKPLHDNTRMLMTELRLHPVGTILFKSDLAKIIGLDLTKQPSAGGGATYLTGAIRQLEKENIVYRPLPRADVLRLDRGPGIIRLDVLGKQKWAAKRAKTASNVAHVAQRVMSTITDQEYNSLSYAERAEVDVTRVTLKLHKHLGSTATQRRIEIGVKDRNAQLSINQTLQVLLMPDGEEQQRLSAERVARAQNRR